MHIETLKQTNGWLLFDNSIGIKPHEAWFEPDFWQQQGAIVGSAKGRGTAWFFQHQQQQYVLRHYLRGGLIGKLVNDKYMGLDYRQSRPVREMLLLAKIAELNLPAPKPFAVQIKKAGWFSYRADLIMQRIENAQDAYQLLSEGVLISEQWLLIGATIARFHKAGVFHHDLNIHNILLDQQGECWIIDFDQGRIRQPNAQWQQKNLDRLERSLHKEKQLNPNFGWRETDWHHLLRGYQTEMD